MVPADAQYPLTRRTRPVRRTCRRAVSAGEAADTVDARW